MSDTSRPVQGLHPSQPSFDRAAPFHSLPFPSAVSPVHRPLPRLPRVRARAPIITLLAPLSPSLPFLPGSDPRPRGIVLLLGFRLVAGNRTAPKQRR